MFAGPSAMAGKDATACAVCDVTSFAPCRQEAVAHAPQFSGLYFLLPRGCKSPGQPHVSAIRGVCRADRVPPALLGDHPT